MPLEEWERSNLDLPPRRRPRTESTNIIVIRNQAPDQLVEALRSQLQAIRSKRERKPKVEKLKTVPITKPKRLIEP
jgi:uncharacterized sporulation protein YeaH/YhbH (DUF444 family)